MVRNNREVNFSFPVDDPPPNPSNPLFLHPSDDPDTILVVELLTSGNNYVNWSRCMKTALLTKNKVGFY